METPTAPRRLRRLIVLARALIALGVSLVVIGLAAAWGAVSSLGPVLFLVGAFVAVLGGAVHYDVSRSLSDPFPGDPRFTPAGSPKRS
ncbi:MAG: hypothetical protein LBE25_15575 [Arthrobacter sp.]|jgi:membrane-bound ClpP family serine protease|nr:hypothetical protein [Arthrobacter sp.]